MSEFEARLTDLASDAIDGAVLREMTDAELQSVIDSAEEIEHRALKERDRRKA